MEQVSGFVFPGELLGLDAIETDRHQCAAVTLEPTSVCEIPPYDRLQALCVGSPKLDYEVHRMFGRAIATERRALLVIRTRTARERLAGFLLDLGQRFKEQGYSGEKLVLSMRRHELANYLCATQETVSRLFARFELERALSTHGRHVKIDNMQRLHELAGPQG